MSNRVLFSAYTTTSGTELWVSDGTAAGTSLVKDISPGKTSTGVLGLTQFGNRVLFNGADSAHGTELWTTDGTAAGTYLLKDISPGAGSGVSTQLFTNGTQSSVRPAGGKMVFLGDDGTTGLELWVTDGTSAGTSQLRDIYAGSKPSNPSFFTAFGNKQLFQAFDGLHKAGDNLHGQELWVTDGTPLGTSLLADLDPGIYGSGSPRTITDLGTGRAIFSAAVGSASRELWVTDGTAGGTSLLKDITPGAYKPSNPGQAALVGNTGLAVFAARGVASHAASGGGNEGTELWVTDGTPANTSMLRTFGNGYEGGNESFLANSSNGNPTALGSRVLFEGTDGGVSALWATDGTALGTVKISSDGVLAGKMFPFGTKDLFWSSTGLNAVPWITDGTPAGTFQLSTTAKSGEAAGFSVVGGRAVFEATSALGGTELWSTDGTAAGTGVLQDINTLTNGSSSPSGFASSGGKVFFAADDGIHGRELWATDGLFNTTLVKDINNVTYHASSPTQLTAVTFACFAAGTRISTVRGDVAVEALRPGDLVPTVSGATRPVRWIGHRSLDLTAHPRPRDVAPVRIAAHAFGDNLPHTALRVSPDHAIHADGVLVPARYLVNGATIVREAAGRVTWYHVELAGPDGEAVHDVLLAEGLPAESYLDTGNRSAFANGGGAVDMHPDFARAVWQRQGCARLVTEGAELVAIRSWLAARAGVLGHDVTADPAIAFSFDGVERQSVRIGNTHHFAVPAGARSLRLNSRSAVPAEIGEDATDTRRLGVAVTAIERNGVAAPLDHPSLGAGWHEAEPGLRWTEGDATIDVSGLDHLELSLLPALGYWQERRGPDAKAAAA